MPDDVEVFMDGEQVSVNGQFDFGKQLDLRRFVERLHTFGLNAVLRMGCSNGGGG